MSVLSKYKCPRDAIPEIVARLDASVYNGIGEVGILEHMELDPKEAVSLLMLEIHRLKNNMVHCRRAAKRAYKRLDNHVFSENMMKSELNDIIEIVDDVEKGLWYQ